MQNCGITWLLKIAYPAHSAPGSFCMGQGRILNGLNSLMMETFIYMFVCII